jgi:hypothetical protein
MKILLDASPLSAISHPQASLEIVSWFFTHLKNGHQIIVSELADYEVRRELIRAGKQRGIQRLDALQRGPGAERRRAILDPVPVVRHNV